MAVYKTKLSDFNPHPLWRGRPGNVDVVFSHYSISIHTLCEEGDLLYLCTIIFMVNFNPHPLWRGRHFFIFWAVAVLLFQSTPSVKRATGYVYNNITGSLISIHTLCEEGDQLAISVILSLISISIHTLCEEGDEPSKITLSKSVNFNPHPLWRGRL